MRNLEKLPNHDGVGKPYGLFLIAFQAFLCVWIYIFVWQEFVIEQLV